MGLTVSRGMGKKIQGRWAKKLTILTVFRLKNVKPRKRFAWVRNGKKLTVSGNITKILTFILKSHLPLETLF